MGPGLRKSYGYDEFGMTEELENREIIYQKGDAKIYGERNNARGKELEPVKQFLKDRGYKMTVIKKYVYAEKEAG